MDEEYQSILTGKCVPKMYAFGHIVNGVCAWVCRWCKAPASRTSTHDDYPYEHRCERCNQITVVYV